jgi:hypothetical protein
MIALEYGVLCCTPCSSESSRRFGDIRGLYRKKHAEAGGKLICAPPKRQDFSELRVSLQPQNPSCSKIMLLSVELWCYILCIGDH